jgi:hypothetical protein
MFITGKRLMLALTAITLLAGIALAMSPEAPWLSWVVIATAALSFIVLMTFHWPIPDVSMRGPRESEDVRELSPQRIRELVRGTSMYLRELRYRYSIRLDPNDAGEHRSFSAEVNTVKLGFVPVIITDNTNDRQGLGYVAFVHDGRRWRGPGLPCPAGQVEAVRHAAKCVSPLAKEEETRF